MTTLPSAKSISPSKWSSFRDANIITTIPTVCSPSDSHSKVNILRASQSFWSAVKNHSAIGRKIKEDFTGILCLTHTKVASLVGRAEEKALTTEDGSKVLTEALHQMHLDRFWDQCFLSICWDKPLDPWLGILSVSTRIPELLQEGICL